jgi:hypothetical protein
MNSLQESQKNEGKTERLLYVRQACFIVESNKMNSIVRYWFSTIKIYGGISFSLHRLNIIATLYEA